MNVTHTRLLGNVIMERHLFHLYYMKKWKEISTNWFMWWIACSINKIKELKLQMKICVVSIQTAASLLHSKTTLQSMLLNRKLWLWILFGSRRSEFILLEIMANACALSDSWWWMHQFIYIWENVQYSASRCKCTPWARFLINYCVNGQSEPWPNH